MSGRCGLFGLIQTFPNAMVDLCFLSRGMGSGRFSFLGLLLHASLHMCLFYGMDCLRCMCCIHCKCIACIMCAILCIILFALYELCPTHCIVCIAWHFRFSCGQLRCPSFATFVLDLHGSIFLGSYIHQGICMCTHHACIGVSSLRQERR